MIPTEVHVVECPRCGFDLRSDPLPPEPEPSPDRAVLGGDGSPPPDRRWIDVSLSCPHCSEPVGVFTAARQDGDGDDEVIVHAGDVWRCEAGHVGTILVTSTGSTHQAFLSEAVFAGRSTAWAESASGSPAVTIRAPLRGGGAS